MSEVLYLPYLFMEWWIKCEVLCKTENKIVEESNHYGKLCFNMTATNRGNIHSCCLVLWYLTWLIGYKSKLVSVVCSSEKENRTRSWACLLERLKELRQNIFESLKGAWCICLNSLKKAHENTLSELLNTVHEANGGSLQRNYKRVIIADTQILGRVRLYFICCNCGLVMASKTFLRFYFNIFSWPCPDFMFDQDLRMTPYMHVLVGVQGEDSELQQVPWFALLQAVENTMECYSLAAANLLPCCCKWSRKTTLREMSCYVFFCQSRWILRLDWASTVTSSTWCEYRVCVWNSCVLVFCLLV